MVISDLNAGTGATSWPIVSANVYILTVCIDALTLHMYLGQSLGV